MAIARFAFEELGLKDWTRPLFHTINHQLVFILKSADGRLRALKKIIISGKIIGGIS